jgi:HEPN domain-containing protein
MLPTVHDAFDEVAIERAKDASMLRQGGRPHGAVYLPGYAVECRLKAILQRMGVSFPASGPEGHHLRDLWRAAGFDLETISAHRRHFIRTWSTDMRYQVTLGGEVDYQTLYEGAIALIGYLQTRIQRGGNRRRR